MKVRTAVIGVGVVALLGVGWFAREHRIEQGRCDTVASLDQRLPKNPDAPIAVVGDSYAAGWGLDSYDQAWPALLGVPVDVTAYPGAGWGREGTCDRPTITEAAAAGAPGRTLIVQAGLNDTLWSFSEDTIRDAVADLEGKAAKVIVVGPPDAPDFNHEQRIDMAMQLGFTDLELTSTPVNYVQLTGVEIEMQEDGQHPTAAGHAAIAAQVRAALG